MERECKKHGLTDHAWEECNNRWKCKKCRSEAVAKSRRKRKADLVDYAGGKCADCGGEFHPAVFDFHHRNPDEKSFGLSSKGKTKSLEACKAEVDKCDLLCANCHRLRHAND